MRIWAIIAAVIALAGQASAGAWPREPGGVFVSISEEVKVPRDALSESGLAEDPVPDVLGYRSLYAEYGLTPKLTLGLDYGQTSTFGSEPVADLLSADAPDVDDAAPLRSRAGVIFLRYALAEPDDVHQWAVQLGVGQRRWETQGAYFPLRDTNAEAIARPLIAYGRGWSWGSWGGWVSVEASAELRETSGGTPAKLDTTIGRSTDGLFDYLLQFESGKYPQADPFLRVLPGATLGLGPVTLQASAIYGAVGEETVGAKLGLWVAF